MKALVGYTGFVGSNLYASGEFDAVYNSKNIKEAYGTTPDLLVYAGLRAEKYLANNAPEQDMELIIQAEKNITKINPQKVVLISTIDVFKVPVKVDETSIIDAVELHAYGYNRYQLELWVRRNYPDALIIRLPGLFGKNLKKNFIYDYINRIPSMLTTEKFKELSSKDSDLKNYYKPQKNGFYTVDVSDNDRKKLKNKFAKLGFSALNFTDSRSIYQFYNLERLWKDIQIALDAGIFLWHPAVEPISIGELYLFLSGKRFVNELPDGPVFYDCQTRYAPLFGGIGKYLCSKKETLKQVKKIVEEMTE